MRGKIMSVEIYCKGSNIMRETYKYEPERFKDILGLCDDLSVFYSLHAKYKQSNSKEDKFNLENHWENLLFFTIKHREIEGYLSPSMASDIRIYCEELLYD